MKRTVGIPPPTVFFVPIFKEELMPKNKLQGTVFGLIMSYAMAIGMEVYNIAYKMGFHLADGGFSSMTNAVLPECQPHSFLPSGSALY